MLLIRQSALSTHKVEPGVVAWDPSLRKEAGRLKATILGVTSISCGGDVGLHREGRRWVLVADRDKGLCNPEVKCCILKLLVPKRD